nr:hypothetical protein [uncultured Rothia sp.]
MTHLRINRRTLLTGTVALGTVGLLAACGGGSDKKISGKAASSTEEIVKNLEINKQDRSSLKQVASSAVASLQSARTSTF